MFGATDIVTERGEEALKKVRQLTGGYGVHSVLECVGTDLSTQTSLNIVRPGGAVGRVGVPPRSHHSAVSPDILQKPHYQRRSHFDELLPDVLEARLEPGRVFDFVSNIDGVTDDYLAMNEREAIKAWIEF